jgi:Predicted nucleic acid-binding protein, contains PIN domain
VGLKLDEIPEGTRVFIDANIFLYSAFKHPDFGQSCKSFFERVREGKVAGCSSGFVLNEVFHKLMIAEVVKTFGVRARKATGLLKDNPDTIAELSMVWMEMELIGSFNISLLSSQSFPAFVEMSRKYKLMATDAIHVSMMKLNEISDIATNDNDFERVEELTIWRP